MSYLQAYYFSVTMLTLYLMILGMLISFRIGKIIARSTFSMMILGFFLLSAIRIIRNAPILFTIDQYFYDQFSDTGTLLWAISQPLTYLLLVLALWRMYRLWSPEF